MMTISRTWRSAAMVCLATLGGLPTLGSLRAQEPDVQVRVAALIRKLGSDSYEQRKLASDELSKLGVQTRLQIEQAALSEDAEVRLRAKELLKQIKTWDLWSPGIVSYKCEKQPAAKILAAIAEQTGNRLLVGDQYGTFQDADVDLDYPDGSFWEVLDDLCRQSKNHVRSHYDTRNPGLVVVSGGPGKNPVAYAGPVRAQITSARRVFIEELDYDDLDSEKTHTFQLHMQVMWEDRFRLVAYRSQPELVEALTDNRLALSATQPSGSGWNVANQGTHQLTMELRLHPPATSAKRLDTLKLKWGLIAVGDIATIEVSDLNSTSPHFQDDIELIVESMQESAGARYEVTVLANRDLVIPEPQEVLFQENDLSLIDGEGRPFRKQGQTNSLTDRGARIRLSFAGESTDSKPKLLRFAYPRIRAKHDLEITFRDVPLPVGRPE
jgi:hypothetical protein